jgi:hypothetical protein
MKVILFRCLLLPWHARQHAGIEGDAGCLDKKACLQMLGINFVNFDTFQSLNEKYYFYLVTKLFWIELEKKC